MQQLRPYQILATDYDGTLAKDDQVDDRTLDALSRWRSTGRQLVLIGLRARVEARE